jgi:transcriptional regulator with PAS, ATPase and Fis domain
LPPPDGSEITRERLRKLRNGLLHLHKSLLDSERSAYERDIQRIASPGQFLDLLLNDPWFGWLRELSQFIVLIDETLDLENPPTDAETGRLITEARELVSPAEEGAVFARRYWEAMQRDPAAVLAHRDMIRVFGEL